MSYCINNIFTTITSNPLRRENYIEIEPCEALKPYIRCFWGSKYNRIDSSEIEFNKSLVIPDVCMDIIITLNNNNGKISSGFCGANNTSFVSVESDNICFGIRFYAWSVVLFSCESMNRVLNTFSDVEEYFSGFAGHWEEEIIYANNIYDRKEIAEKYLLRMLNTKRENSDIMNSVYFIINHYGNTSVKDLSEYCFISKRQLERKFVENTGVSPKQMINLIRYQLLWQNSLRHDFNIFNCVEKFGFCDQSHLLKEFKKYHGISLSKARNMIIK